MNIYLIARQLQSTGADVPERMLAAIGPEHVKRIVEPTEGWLDWGDALYSELARRNVAPHSVRSFQIAAHGSSGRIYIGLGLGYEDVWHLAPLARFVAPGPSVRDTVVLNGCNVAASMATEQRMFSDSPGAFATGQVIGTLCTGWGASHPTPRGSAGYQLLLNFARVFRGAAVAGVDSQPGGVQWTLVGPTLRVRPDDTYDVHGFDMEQCFGFSHPS
jgi:hypothetical protein